MYFILLILTDGEVHDMVDTINELVYFTQHNLPISIIFVGIGDSDFANMVRLDGDDVVIAEGSRDIVQFVKFNEVVAQSEQSNQIKDNLAAMILEEVPTHMVEWYSRNQA
jgi:hypothetical protein